MNATTRIVVRPDEGERLKELRWTQESNVSETEDGMGEEVMRTRRFAECARAENADVQCTGDNGEKKVTRLNVDVRLMHVMGSITHR